MQHQIAFASGPDRDKSQKTDQLNLVIHRMMAGEQGWVKHAYRLDVVGEFGRPSVYVWDHCEVHGELTRAELDRMMKGVARDA